MPQIPLKISASRSVSEFDKTPGLAGRADGGLVLQSLQGGLAAGGKEIRTLGPSRGQNAVGAHLSGDPWLCGSNPEDHGGGCRRYEFDCVCQYLAAGLRHRAQPCSGCAGFRSRRLIPDRAVSALDRPRRAPRSEGQTCGRGPGQSVPTGSRPLVRRAARRTNAGAYRLNRFDNFHS
jgi:hypothetical protein